MEGESGSGQTGFRVAGAMPCDSRTQSCPRLFARCKFLHQCTYLWGAPITTTSHSVTLGGGKLTPNLR